MSAKKVVISFDKYQRMLETVKSTPVKEKSEGQLNKTRKTDENHLNSVMKDTENEASDNEKLTDKSHHSRAGISLIPKYLRNRNTKLISFILSCQEISWNSRGELICDEKPIHGSNITDLIRDATLAKVTKTPPIGADFFYYKLADCNIPFILIKNIKRRQYLYHLGGVQHPPGSLTKPNTSHKPSSKHNFLWRKWRS